MDSDKQEVRQLQFHRNEDALQIYEEGVHVLGVLHWLLGRVECDRPDSGDERIRLGGGGIEELVGTLMLPRYARVYG